MKKLYENCRRCLGCQALEDPNFCGLANCKQVVFYKNDRSRSPLGPRLARQVLEQGDLKQAKQYENRPEKETYLQKIKKSKFRK